MLTRKILAPRSGWAQTVRYLLVASVVTISITYLLRSQDPYSNRTPSSSIGGATVTWGGLQESQIPDPASTNLPPYKSIPEAELHPIDHLIRDAQKAQQELLTKRSHNLADAAKRYRERRGRHPPPGFDAWFQHASENDAIVIEDFFDRIYHDLRPFWALPARDVRLQANSNIQVIRVRNGHAVYVTDNPNRVPWIQLWHSIVAEAAPYLPDVDMPINYMDETRVMVPWEIVDRYVKIEERKRKMPPAEDVISTYPGLAELDKAKGPPHNPNWVFNDANRYWEHAKMSCPPDSEARNSSAITDFLEPIEFPTGWSSYSHHGFIKNWTEAQDPCLQPHLRGMHGSFVEAVSMATTHELIPLFGGSKLSVNNDILLPGAMYLKEAENDVHPDAVGIDWSRKHDRLIWRGIASGGRNKAFTWHRFHRHRFVQSLNASTIAELERTKKGAKSFELPYSGVYDIPTQKNGQLGEWVGSFADVGFVSLECFPRESRKGKPSPHCSYTNDYYSLVSKISTKQQFMNKYVPDIDGNSFSGRWRGSLLSNSLPMKATIYKEWHDDRLMPWVHFVPFDNTYQDIYAIMDYFLHDHDSQARRIAEEGQAWAHKVLRREDMMLYVWRLLLEFARICDENRDKLGYVGDLV